MATPSMKARAGRGLLLNDPFRLLVGMMTPMAIFVLIANFVRISYFYRMHSFTTLLRHKSIEKTSYLIGFFIYRHIPIQECKF
ncbi:hypothetical protein HY29_06035 [Hyphomonas beringensis]|uniref:Uncharacterized protein n=1 Tax=Hyphomonas beringensis TaxID=1280946 RepID=A0A062U476_9PROT|nr:hypothetical protein HY29_06035 [Hyphomonas beringensis]